MFIPWWGVVGLILLIVYLVEKADNGGDDFYDGE